MEGAGRSLTEGDGGGAYWWKGRGLVKEGGAGGGSGAEPNRGGREGVGLG